MAFFLNSLFFDLVWSSGVCFGWEVKPQTYKALAVTSLRCCQMYTFFLLQFLLPLWCGFCMSCTGAANHFVMYRNEHLVHLLLWVQVCIMIRPLSPRYWLVYDYPNLIVGFDPRVGGHTAEMLNLLSLMQTDRFKPRFYIAAATDNMSLQKACLFENSLVNKVDFIQIIYPISVDNLIHVKTLYCHVA